MCGRSGCGRRVAQFGLTPTALSKARHHRTIARCAGQVLDHRHAAPSLVDKESERGLGTWSLQLRPYRCLLGILGISMTDHGRYPAQCRVFPAGISRMRMTAAIALLFLLSSPGQVASLPLTIFRYQDQAQRHCPSDTVVWLDFAKRTYYSRAHRKYGQGFKGSYMCRNEARSGGYRRSLIGLR